MVRANSPAATKKKRAVTRYRIPTSLWLVVNSHLLTLGGKISWLIGSLCTTVPILESCDSHHVQSCNHSNVSGPAQLKALDGVIPGLVGDEPDRVGSSPNGVCFDLELYYSEIVENIGAGNVEDDSRVDWHPEEIGV